MLELAFADVQYGLNEDFMSAQFRQIVESKILETVEAVPLPITRRQATVPTIKSKAKRPIR